MSLMRLNSWIARHASCNLILGLLIPTAVLQILLKDVWGTRFAELASQCAEKVSRQSESCEFTTTLDLKIDYDAAYAKALLSGAGDEAWQFYLTRFFATDLIYPAVYSLFLALMASYLLQQGFSRDSWLHRLTVLPLIAAAFDYMENFAIVGMALNRPDFSHGFATFTSYLSLGKWLFVSAAGLLVLFGFIKLIYDRLAGPPNPAR